KTFPGSAEPLESLAIAQNAMGRHDLAAESAKKGLTIAPDRPQLYREMAQALYALGDVGPMRPAAQFAAANLPKDKLAVRMAAVAELVHGNKQAAKDRFAQLLELDPGNGAAHRAFAELQEYDSKSDRHLKQLQKLNRSNKVSDFDKYEVLFALGKAFHDLADTDACFAHYAKANALKKKALGLGVDPYRQEFALIRTSFAACGQRLIDTAPNTPITPRPILVVGMPRSGTTLIESILAAHSQVGAAGELGFFQRRLLPEITRHKATPSRAFSDATIQALRADYAKLLTSRGGAFASVVDKMPSNFSRLGHILALVPNARAINLVRHPVAVGWSNFRQCYIRKTNGFAYAQTDIAEYYALYHSLMAVWKEAFPDRILDLHYDALVDRPEETVAEVLAFLSLDWEDDCLAFHQKNRPVATASAFQVRSGIYKDSTAAWHPFEDHLKPMIDRMRALGVY
ncbi:MAG: sulfotransferase, partial [Paracoccaceae bacterium]|nr:sulfotransferase [Paracoccaceae bacterium]